MNPYIDFSGWQIVGDSVSRAAHAAYPEINGGFTFSVTYLEAPKLFTWIGIPWMNEVYLSRLFFILLALGLVMTSVLFFDRFNPSRLLPIKRTKNDSSLSIAVPAHEATPPSSFKLTPLINIRTSFRFEALFLADLKLFVKGQQWWWYAIAVGLVVAQLFSPLQTTRILLIVGWVWHILILSTLGNRENRFDMRQIVFSAPRPVLNQLPAAWLSAFVVTAALGSGALIKFILIGEWFSMLGWFTGVLFIPSLALILGTFTGSSKPFEVVYVLWMYILTQKASAFDFAGITLESPLYIYAPLAVGLFALALLVR